MSEALDKAVEFAWYHLVEGDDPLEQGDFLDRFPIPTYPDALVGVDPTVRTAVIEEEIEAHRFSVVLITQTCDLEDYSDDKEALLLPRYSYRELCKSVKSIRGRDGWARLVKERIIGLHLLSECTIEGHAFEYQVVDLQSVFSVRLGAVKAIARAQAPRVRLLPPYREHLAQAFARQFMRIGLPVGIPRESPFH